MARQEGSLRKEKFLVDESVAEGGNGGLRYKKGVALGNLLAGKDLAVTVTATTVADEYPKIKMAGVGDPILGRLESIEADGYASIAVGGDRIYFAKGGTPVVGLGIIGYSNAVADRGKVVSPDITVTNNSINNINNTIEEIVKTRGMIVMVNVPGDPDVVQVLLP